MSKKAKHPEQRWGWRYRYGLRELERAYRAARKRPDEEIADIHRRAEAFQTKVDAGEETWAQTDEDGQILYDYGDHLGDELFDEENVLSLIKIAFVISLHHYIEQTIWPRVRSNERQKYEHRRAMNWLIAQGWNPDKEVLKNLELAANCAKHGEGGSAQSLYERCPDMFDDRIAGWGSAPSHETLKLSDLHIDGFFEAAAGAVPQMPISL